MNHPVIPIAVHRAEVNAPVTKERKRQAPKGRRVDPAALADVQRLLGDEPRRADLLIEHLHKIQDEFGHLPSTHLAALAQEMRLAQTEGLTVHPLPEELGPDQFSIDMVWSKRAAGDAAITWLRAQVMAAAAEMDAGAP